jgi:hypothetical protein
MNHLKRCRTSLTSGIVCFVKSSSGSRLETSLASCGAGLAEKEVDRESVLGLREVAFG